MVLIGEGGIRKLATHLNSDGSVAYAFRLDDCEVPINDLIGHRLKLVYRDRILCTHCGRKTNKSFSQGYCFPCFKKLAACDTCIVSPEKCHFSEGTCREPEWGRSFCFQPHIVYLANSAGLKVGITRETQVPTRWIDQGATAALPLYRVNSRYLSGCIEVVCKQFVSDRTPWQSMLKGKTPELDLYTEAANLVARVERDVLSMSDAGAGDDMPVCIEKLSASILNINYPVTVWPDKVVSLSFDKSSEIEGRLLGVKGQYLILDTGCLNIRKFTAYQISIFSDAVI
ncbi:MAG: DUF2797 domain-containing protein [Hahellaceae bacterium]|nr:DUF2797 domain-containing protein [Hahellaceae bacterium]